MENKMTDKNLILSYMQVAGYHNDFKRFTRLLCENNINKKQANEAFSNGITMRINGIKCKCYDCNELFGE